MDSASSTGARRLPPRQLLGDDVREAIQSLIMDHAIAPGQRVSIDGLARELGVSATPVREALSSLESSGLVRKEPLRGYSATPLLTREEFDDLFRLRMLLEPWAAEHAASAAGADAAARLEAELAAFPEASGAGYVDYKEVTAHDSRFHSLVAELSGSFQLRQALERTHCHLHLFRLFYGTAMARPTMHEHARIAKAIAARRPDRARAAMLAHLEASRRRLDTAAFR